MQINVMSSEVICNVCPGLCENMQLTKKAAADRKHHLNHAYPPLTAKTEPLLEPFLLQGFGPLFALSDAPVGFASGPLQGVVIVFSLVKFLIGAFSGLLQRQ